MGGTGQSETHIVLLSFLAYFAFVCKFFCLHLLETSSKEWYWNHSLCPSPHPPNPFTILHTGFVTMWTPGNQINPPHPTQNTTVINIVILLQYIISCIISPVILFISRTLFVSLSSYSAPFCSLFPELPEVSLIVQFVMCLWCHNKSSVGMPPYVFHLLVWPGCGFRDVMEKNRTNYKAANLLFFFFFFCTETSD